MTKNPFPIIDGHNDTILKLLEEAKAAAQASLENPAAFLELAPIFDGIRENEAFVAEFVAAATSIRENGLRGAIQAAVANE